MDGFIPQTANDEPETKYLNRHVRTHVCGACVNNPLVWKDLGIELLGQEGESELNIIAANSGGNVIKCCSSMFSLWLERQPEASWKQLIKALIKVNLVSLAKDIEKLLTPSEQQQSSQQTSITLQDIERSFTKFTSIEIAYTRLLVYLFHPNAFGSVELSNLKAAVICHGNAPRSVRLEKTVEKEILAATSHENLRIILNNCCDWLHIQLLEKMAHVFASEAPIAVKIIERYNEIVFSKNLREALPYFVSMHKEAGTDERLYITEVCVKAHKNPAYLTIKEFIEWDWKAKDTILKDLLNRTPIIEHIKEGCLEVYFSISANYDFDAYKMTLFNRHQLYTVDVIHVEIGKHPLIYNSLFFDLKTQFTIHYHYEVITQICDILFNNKSMDDIVSSFHLNELVTNDEKEIFQYFAPNKYLQKQFLLKHLYNWKLPVWLVLCDALQKVKSMEYTSNEILHVLKEKFPQMVSAEGSVLHETNQSYANTLRNRQTVDDIFPFSKPYICQSYLMALLTYPFHHVKHIKPSEVESEFQYVTGHVIELLSYCHPVLLIERCRQLMASEVHKINLFTVDFVEKLKNFKTSSAVLKMVCVFWSWNNHSILTSLAEFSRLAVTLLEEFSSRIVLFYPIASYPFSSIAIPFDVDKSTLLVYQCKADLKGSLHLVFDVQSLLTEKCDITQHAIQLLAAKEDPIELQWMISPAVVDLVNQKINQHFQCFANKGIVAILIYPDAKYCIKYHIKGEPMIVLSTKEGSISPLHNAAKNGYCSVLESLIKCGADVKAIDNDQLTPLHYAAYNGHGSVVEYLITSGADVNAANNQQFTPLHAAAQKGYCSVLESLINYGANVNVVTNNQVTPLHYAVCNGHGSVVEYLITSGADVNAVDNQKFTPLHNAAEKGHCLILENLIKNRADVNVANNIQATPLHYGAYNGHGSVVEYLITSGADVNAVDNTLATPLYYAAQKGYCSVLESLIKYGANVNVVNNQQLTPLHTAAAEGHCSVLESLIKYGANVNVVTDQQLTPLHTAAEKGHCSVLESLIKYGANINAVNNQQLTPLYYAAYHGHLSVVEYLISSGADINNAVKNQQSTPLHAAAQMGHCSVLEILIKYGANVNVVNYVQSTPLHFAANNGHGSVVDYLITSGADVNAVNNRQNIPLHYAAEKGHISVLKILINYGANINAVNKVPLIYNFTFTCIYMQR